MESVTIIQLIKLRAGCNSRPAVRPREPKGMIRCDSGGDSKVWMEEMFILIFYPEVFITWPLFFFEAGRKPYVFKE